ncbi:hypothetical protein CEXT_465131 [Caerostris extrusa]|uniref:Uncharacterized protein n=1 Tax=Caerostris extrusa TaxID=172846 RepID=A0AAV4MAW3_CAEEX|nr:hypothetical protein CEXT_465131 [Caerostris extrusa]
MVLLPAKIFITVIMPAGQPMIIVALCGISMRGRMHIFVFLSETVNAAVYRDRMHHPYMCVYGGTRGDNPVL